MRVTGSLIDQFLYSSDDGEDEDQERGSQTRMPARGSYFHDDPRLLQRLYEESAQHPVLSREQEFALAQRIEAGDEEAQREFARHNVRLVLALAKQHTGHGVSHLGLAEVGLERLVQVIPKFDWRRGLRFSTYATPHIRGAIKDELLFRSTRGKFQEIYCEDDVYAALRRFVRPRLRCMYCDSEYTPARRATPEQRRVGALEWWRRHLCDSGLTVYYYPNADAPEVLMVQSGMGVSRVRVPHPRDQREVDALVDEILREEDARWEERQRRRSAKAPTPTQPTREAWHGTRSGYRKHGCRCAACRDWNARNAAQRRARRAARNV